MRRRFIGLGFCFILAFCGAFGIFYTFSQRPVEMVKEKSSSSITFEMNVQCTVYHYRNGILMNVFGDTEVLTNIGKNFTAFKISGDLDWIHAGYMLYNVTFLGWGDQGSLSASSVILPNEITRYDVKANFTYISLGKWNYTAYWKPASSGNVDCVGLYWHSSGNNLFCYDVFGQVAYTTADEFYSYWQFQITYS